MIGRFVWSARKQFIAIVAFAMWAAPAFAQSAGAVRPGTDLPGMTAGTVQEAVAGEHSLQSSPEVAPMLATQGTNGLSLVGNVAMQINGSTVRLTVDKVENTSLTRTSGTLRLNLWFSSISYRGVGYSTALYIMGQLAPNTYFGPIDQTVSFSAPSTGCYYVTVFLEELQSSGSYTYADYVDFVCTSNCDATGTRISINGGCNNSTLPNLTPYQPSGWSDKVVVTTTSGSRTDATTIRPTDTVYVNFGVINNGNSATGARFYTALQVDGTTVTSFYTDPPLNSNFFQTGVDYSLGTLSAGTHTIGVVVDSTGVIAESNESDNSYSKTITVSAGQAVKRRAAGRTPTPPPGYSYVLPNTLPNACVGIPYSFNLDRAVGGTPPYYYVKQTGSQFPPLGLVIQPAGLLTGTPTIADTRVFTVDAVDLGGHVASSTTSLRVLVCSPSFSLTIATTGTGSGTVTSSPSGIACGATCSASFASGASVTLTATPATGSTFSGWSGACSGTSTTCTLTMNSNESVTATFAASGPPPQDSVTPASANLGMAGGCPGGMLTGTFQVTAASNVSWTAVGDRSGFGGVTVDVSPRSGSGPGTLTVTITVAPQKPSTSYGNCTQTYTLSTFDNFGVTFSDGGAAYFTAYWVLIGVT